MAQIYDSSHSGQEIDSAVDAVQTTIPSQLTQIGLKIGDLTELETTDKTDLVSAINEVKDNSSTTAEDTTYTDTYNLGADNVQEAIDKIAIVGYEEVLTATPALQVVTSYASAITAGTAYRISFSNVSEGSKVSVSIGRSSATTEATPIHDTIVTGGMSVMYTPSVDATHWRMYVSEASCTISISTPITIIDKIKDVDEVPTLGSDKFVTSNGAYLNRFSMTEFEAVWSTNDSTAINAERVGDDVVITSSRKVGGKRCGFNISDIQVGESVYLDFSSDKTISFGVSDALAGTYNQVIDTRKSFIFTKTSASQKYLLTAANTYPNGTVITLTGFSTSKMYSLDFVRARVETLESHDFMPSSYIPVKEGHEVYMAISLGQGCALYGDYFVGYSSSTSIRVYDLQTKTSIQAVSLPTLANTRTHGNTMSFSGTKYDSGDVFPLLYICSGYTSSTSSSVSQVYVVRIVGESGSWTTELIQTINLDFGVNNDWTEFTCDPVNNRAWINMDSNNDYYCVALPDITESEVTINTETVLIDSFSTKHFTMGISTKSSGQGRFFYHNRIYWVSGVPQRGTEGVDSVYICVDNTMTHCTEAVVSLKNFGLTTEPEGCFIWNDDFYVAYHDKIEKIIQN